MLVLGGVIPAPSRLRHVGQQTGAASHVGGPEEVTPPQLFTSVVPDPFGLPRVRLQQTHLPPALVSTFESDWYVSLRREAWELAILDPSHDTVPKAHQGAAASGVLLNIEVDDVDAEYHRLVTLGDRTAVVPIRSEAFGQRHFIISAPDGVLVDVIMPIEPSADFAEQFV